MNANFDVIYAMRISVLALDGLFDTGLAVILDAFSLANNFSARKMGGTPHFDVSIVGVRRKVRSGQGMPIPVQPVGGHAWLDGAAGLLDHREATTTWWLGPLFRQRYPNVLLDESRMLVPTEVGVTAGAAMGHLDLVLWLIRKASPELASVVSRYLLADIRSSQAPYIIPNHLAQADPLILRFERWARDNLKTGFSLQEVASTLATSTRSLQRRCQDVLGKSPLAYFQDLRVEHAQSLLHGSGLDLEAIAAEVGYADGATLRQGIHLRPLNRHRKRQRRVFGSFLRLSRFGAAASLWYR